MRAVALAALSALLVGAAACGPKHSTPAEPPKIDVSCVLGADGANCTFTSTGARGERCVVVLYGSKATGSVVASAETCSGKLAKGATQSIAVRFPRRPADSCGADLAPCTTRVVEPAAAQDVALAWADELKMAAIPTGPPTDEECALAAERIGAAMVREYGEDAAENMGDQTRYISEQCKSEWTRAQLDCLNKADTLNAMGQCFQ